MSTSSKLIPGIVIGVLAGGVAGGVGGYITHDILEKPNAATMQQIEHAEQTQQGVDDFLNSLGGADAGSTAAPRSLQQAQGGQMVPRTTAADGPDVVGGADTGAPNPIAARPVADAGMPENTAQEFFNRPLDPEVRQAVGPADSPDATTGVRPGDPINVLAPLPGSHPDYADQPTDEHVPARIDPRNVEGYAVGPNQ